MDTIGNRQLAIGNKNGEPWRARTSDPLIKSCVHKRSSRLWSFPRCTLVWPKVNNQSLGDRYLKWHLEHTQALCK
jgi:hypothetical protein